MTVLDIQCNHVERRGTRGANTSVNAVYFCITKNAQSRNVENFKK